MVQIDLHGSQVAIVHAEQSTRTGSDQRRDTPEVFFVMDFDQHREFQFRCDVRHLSQLRIVETFGDQQYRIGVGDSCLIDLIGIDEEVFAEYGQIGRRLHIRQKRELASEELLIREARNRRSPTFVISRGDGAGPEGVVLIFGSNPARTRTLSLDFGDNLDSSDFGREGEGEIARGSGVDESLS